MSNIETISAEERENYIRQALFETERLKRVDGFWRQKLRLIDEYPLVKQFEEGKDYLIAGLKPDYSNKEKEKENELMIGFLDCPKKVREETIHRFGTISQGEEQKIYVYNSKAGTEDWGWYLLVSYEPVNEVYEKRFKEYLNIFQQNKIISNNSSWEEIDNLIIGKVKRKIIRKEKEILG